MTDERRKMIRRLPIADAESEAIRIARELVDSTPNENFEISVSRASPCQSDPRKIGKTPSRWIVATECRLLNSPGTVFDGEPMIVVDLSSETAQYAP